MLRRIIYEQMIMNALIKLVSLKAFIVKLKNTEQ